MLSLFPYLLSWNQISPFIIRLVLGGILLYWSALRLRKVGKSNKDYIYGVADVILGVLIVIGLWTQAAVILVGIDLIVRIIEKIRNKAFLSQGVNYYLILLALCLSLLLTGAGRMAFDLAL